MTIPSHDLNLSVANRGGIPGFCPEGNDLSWNNVLRATSEGLIPCNIARDNVCYLKTLSREVHPQIRIYLERRTQINDRYVRLIDHASHVTIVLFTPVTGSTLSEVFLGEMRTADAFPHKHRDLSRGLGTEIASYNQSKSIDSNHRNATASEMAWMYEDILFFMVF